MEELSLKAKMRDCEIVISDIRNLIKKETECEQRLEHCAKNVLEDLKKLPDWEILIDEDIRWHYDKYKDKFFDWCTVGYYMSGDSPHVVFKKGYSNGDEYNALDIDLTVPLEKQIQNKLVETETAIQKELARKEQKEYETYLRLKEKFE